VKLAIYTKFLIILQRFVAHLYFVFEQKGLDVKDKRQLCQIDAYIYSRQDLIVGLNVSGSLVIYAATVGELRAAKVFITELLNKWTSLQLVLIPGQKQYADIYADAYPEAMVLNEFPSLPVLTDQLFELMQPKLCVFIEGPSLHGYFPIRQDLALPVTCLLNKVPLIVVNACLYRKHIASKIDQVEHLLFKNLFKQAVQYWYVPNEHIKHDLQNKGLKQDRIQLMGDIKFDANFNELAPPSIELSEILNNYQKNDCRLIVAGSVNAFEEQKAVISAWMQVLEAQANAVLILAPRYINDGLMMNKLITFFHEQGLKYALRSEGFLSIADKNILLIDTFGELPYFYQQAEIAFAGRGHGVLEPMRYGKPVVVGPHNVWTKENSTSYFLYLYMREHKALVECDNYSTLGQVFNKILNDEPYKQGFLQRASAAVKSQLGVSERIIKHISKHVI